MAPSPLRFAALLLLCACATTPGPDRTEDACSRALEDCRAEKLPEKNPDGGRLDAAKTVLQQFVSASEQGDFERAYTLLSGPLRARYTPERLKSDFAAEPLARERLQRARAALEQPPELTATEARFPIGEGRAVRLVEESGVWRVEALE